jgi:SHAQKYF class myb-like DNA-binding protein
MNKGPWSPREHNDFLRGLALFGAGNWSKISKNCVLTRTPTQVASHAQKHFARANAMQKKKRKSIFDTHRVYKPRIMRPQPFWYKALELY